MQRPDFIDWVIGVMRLVDNERDEDARDLFDRWFPSYLPSVQGTYSWGSDFIYSLDDFLHKGQHGGSTLTRKLLFEAYHAFLEKDPAYVAKMRQP